MMNRKMKPSGLKAQVIADSHGAFIRIREDVDMYVLLGDNDGGWMHDLKYVSERDGKPVACVLGNHDDPSFPSHWPSFIRGPFFEYGGVSFCVIDGCVKKPDERIIGMTQAEYAEAIRRLPPCDAILSHAPPSGVHEASDVSHEGIEALRDKILRDEPYACLYGHMHESCVNVVGNSIVKGVYLDEEFVFSPRLRRTDRTLFGNGSVRNMS